jgi:hypothetical protein
MLWNVRVWCLTASYEMQVEALTQKEAITKARNGVANDMKHWNFSARLKEPERSACGRH